MVGTWAMLRILRSVKVGSADIIIGCTYHNRKVYKGVCIYMCMKTLSDKINDYGYDDDGTPDEDVISVYDIKQFIKEIIEGWASTDEMTKTLFFKLQLQIEQRAGKELI